MEYDLMIYKPKPCVIVEPNTEIIIKPCTAVDIHSESMSFQQYLELSLNNPQILDLQDCSLLQVVEECIRHKLRMHPHYAEQMSCLLNNLRLIEQQFKVVLQPIQISDIFWNYFINFCQDRGLASSTINTMINQLRAILTWGMKYGVKVVPSYRDVILLHEANNEIALTADDVSRITYFDIQRTYSNRRPDFRKTMEKVRDMFVLSCNLYQRHSDMIRITPTCFDRNIFRIVQQKTGNTAIVNIDRYSVDSKTTYRILEKYGYLAPYRSTIGNYNYALKTLMKDIGFTELVRTEERVKGELIVKEIPKYKLISSHTARRTAITIGVLRGYNMHDLKKCSGHTDLRIFDNYICDD